MEKVRFGVIGIGNMGSSHAQNLYDGLIENAQLTAVCDIDENKIKWAEEHLSDVNVYSEIGRAHV